VFVLYDAEQIVLQHYMASQPSRPRHFDVVFLKGAILRVRGLELMHVEYIRFYIIL